MESHRTGWDHQEESEEGDEKCSKGLAVGNFKLQRLRRKVGAFFLEDLEEAASDIGGNSAK